LTHRIKKVDDQSSRSLAGMRGEDVDVEGMK